MEPILTSVVAGFARRLTEPAGRKAAALVLGPRDQRAVESACREAAGRALAEVRENGTSEQDAAHALSLLDLLIAEQGPDDIPALLDPAPPGEETLARWRALAVTSGLDPRTFPVAFDPFVSALLRFVPEELARAARSEDGVLFPPVVLAKLDHLGANIAALSQAVGDEGLARLLPLAPTLLSALERGRSACIATDRRYSTPDLLLTLLAEGATRDCVQSVRPGLAEELSARLARYLRSTPLGDYEPFEWTERPDVRHAQRIAWAQGAALITDLHLLAGFLETPSNTQRQLAALLGRDFDLLREAALRRRTVAPTPGLVFTTDDPD
ncbi:hypothetical protein [Microbispora sp. ATCC PTA-5024]|uniref:hypothetical protein n=1 Tax=Microbispora sp. ATCC PTA-5024 TaxID=316330 RepID=UPI0003DC37ED|nr:hypothetical protein [Microbispora sp. ATCC PTA-5024]ETK33365.1 hypothetical protein MPTA5024_24705 [Microbispora sp. ATCC PTA-5024]